MKFFQDSNPPKVWDRDLNKVTVVFQGGEFETDDPTLINLLVRVGYRHNGDFPAMVETPKAAEPKMVRKKR